MQIGTALPAGIPRVEGSEVVEWARRAEDGPFASLAVIDRVDFDCYEPLVALSAAAAVTRRLLLATTILITPLRNTVLLSKQLASIDRLSGGRLVLGVGIGARLDDYEITGVEHAGRGRRLDEQLAEISEIFESGRVGLGTERHDRPLVLTGGRTGPAFARMARYSDGYIHGGGPPRIFSRSAEEARAAWIDAGRPGAPQLWGQAYFAFGEEAAERGAEYMRMYYSFTGAFAEKLAAGMLTTPREAVEFIRGYQEAGCDHLVMLPAVSGIDQLEQLSEVVAEALGSAEPQPDQFEAAP
jgi:alkanesulfonate monooxygenase SsuD/methylene tetrahydromethanopterin reductase-like flavin-dependent oxidoreductase (luciferase family)